jgi:hypothetical protein
MSHRWRPDLMAILAGVVAGSVVLGGGGRLAMAALPLVTDARRLSPRRCPFRSWC